MKFALFLALIAALSGCAPDFPVHPSAQEVLSALDKPWIGRAGVEESFMRDGNVEAEILAGVCTASPQWLEVAHRMFDTGNAHFGEELSSALAVALVKRPKFVLEKFDYMCHEPEDLPDSCAVPHWRAAALEALSSVKDPALAARKEKCAIDVSRSVGPQSIEEAK